MASAELTRLAAESLYLVLLVSAPALGVALVVGFALGLLQAVTQVQEQTPGVHFAPCPGASPKSRAWGLPPGSGMPKCRYACAVAMRPRGVRWRKPCCSR